MASANAVADTAALSRASEVALLPGNAQTPIRLSDHWLYNGSTASVCVGMSGPECTVVVSSPVDLTSDLPAVTLDGATFRQ